MKYKKALNGPQVQPYNNPPPYTRNAAPPKAVEAGIDDDEPQDDQKDKKKCKKCGKVCIVFSNVFFGFIGAAILAGGLILFLGVNVYGSSLTQQGTLGFISQLAPMANITNSSATQEQKDAMSADMSILTQEISYGLLAIGAVLLLMSILGCVILCCDDMIAAICYGVLLTTVILGQLIILVLFSTGLVNDSIKGKLNGTLQTDYISADKYSGISVTWNFFMLEFGCCGVDNYYDFQNSSSWLNIRRFHTYLDHSGQIYSYVDRLVTPLACCKFNAPIPEATDFEGPRTGATPLCAKTPNATYSNFEKGCWDEVGNVISQNKIIILAVSCFVIVLQVALLVITLMLSCRKIKEAQRLELEENGGVIHKQ